MIATISGQVQSTQANSLVVDCAGVGYLLHVTPQTSTNAKVGQSIQLYTRLIVREDSMTLYGFDDSESAELFDAVTGVSGIGPKSGLAIIAALTNEQISAAVDSEDDGVFRSVPGIGSILVILASGATESDEGSCAKNSKSSRMPESCTFSGIKLAVVSPEMGIGAVENVCK